MLKISLEIFIISHGLVHAILSAAPNPADATSKPGAFFTAAERSWLLPQLGLNAATVQWIGISLVVLSTFGFVLAGLGIFGVAGLNTIWWTLAIISAIFSLTLLIIFWHSWLPAGVLIDVAVLVASIWVKWPVKDIIG